MKAKKHFLIKIPIFVFIELKKGGQNGLLYILKQH